MKFFLSHIALFLQLLLRFSVFFLFFGLETPQALFFKMGMMVLFGCMFLAFSLPAAIFWFVVRKSAKLVIIMYTSAFMWVLAAVSSAIVWNIVIPLKDARWWAVFLAVPFQELFRWLFWKLIKKAEVGLNLLSKDGEVTITRELVSLAAGLGFGCMTAVMQFNMVLDANDGPGSLPSPGCSSVNFAVISALLTLVFFTFNIFWTFLAYQSFEARSRRGGGVGKSDWMFVTAVLSHYVASYITLNNDEGGTCQATLVPEFLLLLFVGLCVWFALGVRIKVNGKHYL